jgi:hypothetical protein
VNVWLCVELRVVVTEGVCVTLEDCVCVGVTVCVDDGLQPDLKARKSTPLYTESVCAHVRPSELRYAPIAVAPKLDDGVWLATPEVG